MNKLAQGWIKPTISYLNQFFNCNCYKFCKIFWQSLFNILSVIALLFKFAFILTLFWS